MDLLYDIIDKLQNKIPLDAKHRDHPLRGNFARLMECHIEPDWLPCRQFNTLY